MLDSVSVISEAGAMPPPDPHHHAVLPLADPDPVTPESIREAIDACNQERLTVQRLTGVRLPWVPYPAWMTEETR